MAEVTHLPDVLERTENYLDYLFVEFRAIPEVAAEWEEWEEPDRLDYVIEWPIREDRLQQLAGWATAGLLTPAQRARYDALLALVAEQRPTIDRLLAE